MPAPLDLVITNRAVADLSGIFTWSATRFGETVAADYLRALDAAFAMLCRHPDAGTRLHDSAAPERAFPCRRHRIFYDVEDNNLTIVRVLHQAMHAKLQFNRE